MYLGEGQYDYYIPGPDKLPADTPFRLVRMGGTLTRMYHIRGSMVPPVGDTAKMGPPVFRTGPKHKFL